MKLNSMTKPLFRDFLISSKLKSFIPRQECPPDGKKTIIMPLFQWIIIKR